MCLKQTFPFYFILLLLLLPAAHSPKHPSSPRRQPTATTTANEEEEEQSPSRPSIRIPTNNGPPPPPPHTIQVPLLRTHSSPLLSLSLDAPYFTLFTSSSRGVPFPSLPIPRPPCRPSVQAEQQERQSWIKSRDARSSQQPHSQAE